MDRGNVLVIGNSGVGKSTLINSVLGEERAETSYGSEGTTKRLTIYESENVPFRIIDSIGFEPTFFKERIAINAVKKWSKESTKDAHSDKKINLIWFCVDGTAAKLFPKVIENLSRATSIWESVPVIVVITKSYSENDRIVNLEMVQNAFAKQKKYSKNLRGVLPVVASPFILNDSAFAPPYGITELIQKTNELLPEGIKASEQDISNFKLKRTRAMAQLTVGASTSAAIAIGAIPIGFPDAVLLAPLEVGLVNGLARIYGIEKEKESNLLLDSITEVGTVSIVAKQAINYIKNIPGVNIAGAVLNAAIAGSIVAAIGEGSIYIFEQIYLGNKSISDIGWAKEYLDKILSTEFVDKANELVQKLSKTDNLESVPKVIFEVFSTKSKLSNK